MTNKQALREEFEQWWEINYHNGNPPRFGWESWRDGDGYQIDDDESELDGMWQAWQAAHSSKLEAAQKSNDFLKGQLAELANFNPDWDKLEASYESWREIAAELLVAKDQIAELTEELDIAKQAISDVESEMTGKMSAIDDALCELLPGVQYMDPPDGGCVTPLEQVRRMVADYREQIAELEQRQSIKPCPKCNDTGMADSGGTQPWGEPIEIECDCRQQDSNTAELVAAGIITKVGE